MNKHGKISAAGQKRNDHTRNDTHNNFKLRHGECKFKSKLAKTSLAQVRMQHSPLVNHTQDVTNQLALPHS